MRARKERGNEGVRDRRVKRGRDRVREGGKEGEREGRRERGGNEEEGGGGVRKRGRE